MYTFDRYDSRNPDHWTEIARNVTGVDLRVYNNSNKNSSDFKEYNCTEIFALKFIKDVLEGKYTLSKKEQEYFNKLVKEYEITRIINELKHLIDLLDLLSDDLVTFTLEYILLKGQKTEDLAIIDIAEIFDKAYGLYLSF